jgi:protein-S-isoprenylcysteine O-methyltransferase Ste14
VPLPFVFPDALLFWATYFWAFAPEFRIVRRSWQRVRQAGSRDQGSLQVIMLGMWVALLAAFPLAWVQSWRVPRQLEYAVFALGLLLLIAGSALRRHCWRLLGTYFTGEVAAQSEQPVIDRGAYAWVRHPSYSGGTLMNVGIGLALGSWASAGLLAVASLAVYSYRIAIEERVLLETLGEPYRRYMAGRKRFIPFVY